jgi:enterochelin esterase-like enzyme
VALHGLGANHATLTGPELGIDRFLAAYVEAGGTPFAIVAADGGRTYWHPRRDGEDASRMVTDELLPLAQDRGLDTSRFGLIGWSMGGYGALGLGGLLGPERVSAIVASSPALWSDPDESSRDGFEDADEYRQHSVFDSQEDLDGIPVRIDIGRGDPFVFEVERYAEGLGAGHEFHRTSGGHTFGYWRRVLPDQLAFLGDTA